MKTNKVICPVCKKEYVLSVKKGFVFCECGVLFDIKDNDYLKIKS